MQKTLGGDRLGAGKKMQVELKEYERSTHDLSYVWRSSASCGTLIPFMKKVALPGDTWDIRLQCEVLTHPTIGPLFGSFKVQLDVFEAAMRLYMGKLHNNAQGIGMKMNTVKFPVLELEARLTQQANEDIDNCQINPSCILHYLGIHGIGLIADGSTELERTFNGIPLLMYWEIYKNYYANKQEGIGAVISGSLSGRTPTVTNLEITKDNGITWLLLDMHPGTSDILVSPADNALLRVSYVGARPVEDEILLRQTNNAIVKLTGSWQLFNESPGVIMMSYRTGPGMPTTSFKSWQYTGSDVSWVSEPEVYTFPLEDIDKMREALLGYAGNAAAFPILDEDLNPYKLLKWQFIDGLWWSPLTNTQEGLAVKTYQSDVNNNWLSTEWIDGPGGIAELTAIDTSGGSFEINTLILAKKMFNVLNRIAVSGGSYNDYLDAVYGHRRHTDMESPVYHGGLSKELVFQEVISNSTSTADEGAQPLGTLAGRGVMSKKHKGGSMTIKVDEPSYIMGMFSLTPRIDYSQGNDWDVRILTIDDLHKPGLDGIGWQELLTENMAWWSTRLTSADGVILSSAGKQPAWVNYMTSVNETHGNFAIEDNEMFMTLNRKYEKNPAGFNIADLTTYIDPAKYNFIFAETSLDAQNFWVQIGVDLEVRRKMSAKVMPNL